MKEETKTTTPAIKYINRIPYVRVIDLAHQWDTTTSNILASCKDHQVPEEYLRRIDGRVWCSLPGLRYRLKATGVESHLTRHIREFLDAHAEKNRWNPEPTTTAAATPVKENAAQAVNATHATRNRARNNAHRLTRQTMRIDKVEQDTRGKYETLTERVRFTGRLQQDDRARIVALEEKMRALDLTMAAITILEVAARLIRLLRRR